MFWPQPVVVLYRVLQSFVLCFFSAFSSSLGRRRGRLRSEDSFIHSFVGPTLVCFSWHRDLPPRGTNGLIQHEFLYHRWRLMRAVLPQTMERLFSHQTSGSKGKGMEATRDLAEELHSTCGQRCKATAVESTAINTKSPTTFIINAFHRTLLLQHV